MHHGKASPLVLTDRTNGDVWSFLEWGDVFTECLRRAPIDRIFSEYNAMLREDLLRLDRKQIENVIEACQQALDKKALQVLKGPKK